jgi:hypothetical protein
MDDVVEPPPRRAGDSRRRARYAPPLRVGAVLSKAFSAWGRNFVPFTLLSLIVHAPILWHFAWATETPERFLQRMRSIEAVGRLGGIIAAAVLAASYTYGVVQQLRRQPASIGKTVAIGLARTPAAIGTSIVAVILLVLPLVPAFLVAFVGRSPIAAGLLAFAGLIAMLVVASIVWVAVPATVIERIGPFKAIARSATLTSRARLRIFGILLVFGAATLAVQKAAESAMTEGDWGSIRFMMWLLQGWDVVVAVPLAAIASAVGYHDLRVAKEGVDVEDLAKVFE